jgi:transglutaminase-like putative cysteine protease
MLLRITHETHLTYSDLINETVMELRMSPRQEQDQHRLSFELSIGPSTSVSSYFDWLGNTVHAFTINAFHKRLHIVATSVVETERPAADPMTCTDRWPLHTNDYSLYDYLQFGGPVVDTPELRDLAKSLQLLPGDRCAHVASRMLNAINDRFTYEKGVTTATSPITDVLRHGRGVCQDFTHLMIGLARACNIPARYVSGFLHGGEHSYRGSSESHAWCELLFPSIGWVGFDPTNNCAAGENFVKLAVGRHYGDVPPHRGLYKGAATEEMKVSVKSEELRVVPAHLAAERVKSLPVQTYGGWREMSAEGVKLVAEMAQQQQQQQEERDKQQQQQQQQ